jgi:hypothetical protein
MAHIKRVFFSADEDDATLLGTGIFDVGDDVRRYVVAQLLTLGAVVDESGGGGGGDESGGDESGGENGGGDVDDDSAGGDQ